MKVKIQKLKEVKETQELTHSVISKLLIKMLSLKNVGELNEADLEQFSVYQDDFLKELSELITIYRDMQGLLGNEK